MSALFIITTQKNNCVLAKNINPVWHNYYMKNYDLKHIAFHVLVGLYFIWLVVFGVLLGIAINNILVSNNNDIARLLLVWISLNFIMGTSLFVVIQLFRNRTLLGRVILFSYGCMALAAVLTVFFIINKV